MDDGAEKNGFGPVCDQRDKQKKRIVKAQLGVIVCSIVLLVIYRMLSYERDLVFTMADFYFMTGASLAIILSEGIRRCCLFAEEYYHIKKRYNGSFSDAFKACLSLQHKVVCIMFVFIFYLFLMDIATFKALRCYNVARMHTHSRTHACIHTCTRPHISIHTHTHHTHTHHITSHHMHTHAPHHMDTQFPASIS